MRIKTASVPHPPGNEGGFVLVTCMVFLMILVVIGLSASRLSTIEYQISVNDRLTKEDFFDQETCLTDGLFGYRTWLTTAYLTSADTAAYFPAAVVTDANGNGIEDSSECKDINGKVIGSFKVKNIETSGTPVAGWQDIQDFNNNAAQHPANSYPKLAYKDKPEPGSGYDPKNFQIRRFVVTSYSPRKDRNVVLQEGAYKIFNKF